MKKFNHSVKAKLTTRDYEALTNFAIKCGVTRAFILRVALRRFLVQKGAYTNEDC